MKRKATIKLNYKMVFKVIGIFLIFEAGFMLFPLGIAWYTGKDFFAFGITSAITLAVGLAMSIGLRPEQQDMRKREGFLLTSLVWVFFSLLGMIPFIIGSPHLNISDAFFESMSGFTTTGASILTDFDAASPSIHFWRSLIQWIGGMGIIIFTLAVLPMLNSSGGMQMFNAEATNMNTQKLRPRVSETAKRIWLCYFILTVILCLLLWAGPMNLYEAVCHGLSTMSTGGFSTRAESIDSWDSLYVKGVVTFFMFLGGMNIALLYTAATGKVKRVWASEAFRVYVWVILGSFILLAGYLWLTNEEKGPIQLTIDPLFEVVSTISSTGYLVNSFDHWGTFPLMILYILMFFGACAGSTSGGAKIDRSVFLVKHIRNEIYRVLHPNAVMPMTYNNKTVSPEAVSKVIAFLTLYGIVIISGAVALSVLNLPLIDSIFASFACVSNTGLGATITDFGVSFDAIPTAGKWMLSALMLIGRLELFTILVLFTPGFWKH